MKWKHDARLQMRETHFILPDVCASCSLFHDGGVLIAKIVKHRLPLFKRSLSVLYLVIKSVCLITLMAERKECENA